MPSSSSIQFWSGFIPVNGGDRIHPTLIAISSTPNLHLARFKASSFSKSTLLLSLSTCSFHVFFGRPRFLLPFNSNSNAFLKTCHHHSSTHACTISLPFDFSIWATVYQIFLSQHKQMIYLWKFHELCLLQSETIKWVNSYRNSFSGRSWKK
mgnify:CR=1 FL=1